IISTQSRIWFTRGDDAKLFDLVVRRFLVTFFPPAEWSRVERVTVVAEEHFRSRDKVLQTPGWRSVLEESDAGAGKLKPLVPGQSMAEGVSVESKAFELTNEQTKPPPRITEARLLSLMENAGRYVDDEEAAEAMKDSGIGTPATRADIIENLISKGYVTRAGRALRPSVKGIRLIDILRRMKADRLASPSLTGQLERHLGDVERKKMSADAFMNEVSDYAEQVVDLTKNFEFEDLYPDDEDLGACPLCSRPVFERSWFYRCKEPPGYDPKARRRKKKGEPPDPNEVEDCPFRVWKDKSGRYVDRRTVQELLANKESRELDGFLTRQGRTFRGQLALVEGEIDLKRVEGGESSEDDVGTPEYEVDERPLATCPRCKEGEIMETRSTFICSNGLKVIKEIGKDETSQFPLKKREIPEGSDYCTALLPRTVCKREITRAEAIEFFTAGKTDVFTDF
ncbi:MAG: DNA topoisomerase, partial [Myxococcota bacterium]